MIAPATAEKILIWILRILGVVTLSALVAVFMPDSWMDAGAQLTSVGPFPDSVLTEYLARSASAIYALIGALLLYLSFDVRRYLDLLAFVSKLTIAFGVVLTWIDFSIGMPADWSWGEGPPTIVIGVVLLWLVRRLAPAA